MNLFSSLGSFFPSSGTSGATSRVPSRRTSGELGTGGVPPTATPDAHVAETVDELLSAAEFKPEDVFHNYWTGQYQLDELRTDLFGHLSGRALVAAVLQVMAYGTDQQQILSSETERQALDQTFLPLLRIAEDEARAEAQARATTGTRRAASPAPLDPRRVVDALYQRRYGDDVTQALALFGGRTGEALLAALDQVANELNDPLLNISDDDRERLREDIATIRGLAEAAAEAEAVLASDPLAPAHTASPHAPAWSPQQARAVLGFLLDEAPCDDLDRVRDLFLGIEGLDLLMAIDQVAIALYDDALVDMIGPSDRQRIDTDLDRLRQSVTVPEEDRNLAELLRSRPATAQSSVQGSPIAPEASSESEAQGSAELPSAEHAPALLNPCVEDVQAQGPRVPPGTRPRVPRLRLTSRSPELDLRVAVYRQAFLDGGIQGLQQSLGRLPPLQQWRVMTELLEDPVLEGHHLGLARLAHFVYQHYIATLGGDRPLERLRAWHRFQSGAQARSLDEHELLPVPTDFEPEAWIRLLRLMVFQRYPQPCRDRNELSDILDLYKQALDVKTARDRAEGTWLDAVMAVLNRVASGHELLEALQLRLGNESNVALALMSGLTHSKVFDVGQILLLRRAAAILMARRSHSLPCIAMPSLQATTPQKLHVLCPTAPTDPEAPQAVQDRYQELLDRWTLHAPLVDSDCQKVRRRLAAPFPTKPDPMGEGFIELTPGEQCDYLLCTVELPPMRVQLALLKVAQSCQGLDDQTLYLLARRLLSELMYSERNYAGRNLPMDWCDILWHFLAGLVRNGLREGLSHGAALFFMRTAVMALRGLIGGYALPLVSVGSFVLTLWTRRHLHALKSPDYQLNPSTLVEVLIEIAPVLNAPALIGVLFATAAGAGLPFDQAEPLYLMNLVRLLRQIMQSGTQPWAYNLRLTDRHGAGLPAQITFFVNCFRDALYLGSSAGTLVYFSRHIDNMVADWGPAQTLGQALLRTAVEVLPSTTNEILDGLNPDLAIHGARLVAWAGALLGHWEDDYMLQPSPSLPWASVDKHMAIQGLGRSFVSPQDLVRVARSLTTGTLSDLFLWLAALLNGFLGAMRGRHLSYMITTDPGASALPPADGSPFQGLSFTGAPLQNPDGLLVGLSYLMALAGHGVRRGARRLVRRGPPPSAQAQIHLVVPPQVVQGEGTPTKARDNPRVQALLQSQKGRSKDDFSEQ